MMHRFNTVARIFDTIATTCQYFLITDCVQVGKPGRKLNLFTITADTSESRLLAFHFFRQVVGVN